jgi:hypothetical protein
MSTSSLERLNALRACASNLVQLPLPFEGYPGEGNSQGGKGWSYLLSSSVSFKKDVDHAIRIQKPEKEKMPEWISRLVTGGQCKTLYVEDLDLDLQPTDSEMIRKLCTLYSVSLINVRIESESAKVAIGPW